MANVSKKRRKSGDAVDDGFLNFVKYLSHFHPVYTCADAIRKRVVRVVVPPKTVLLRPGLVSGNLCYIEKGMLKSTETRDGKENINWILMAPAVAQSARSFHTQSPAPETIETVEETSVIMLSYDDLFYLLESNHDFAVCMFKLMGHITVMRELNFALMGVPDTESRVRRINLLYPGLFSRVPLRILASYLRMTPETLSRIINKEEFAGIKRKK